VRTLLDRLLERRSVRSFVAGAALTPISFGIFLALIHGAGLAIFTASLVRGVLMTPVTFVASRRFTWRGQNFIGVWWQLLIHVISRPVTFGIHQCIMLVSLSFHVHYAWSYLIAVSLTGLFNFYWGEKVTFSPRWAQRRAARLQLSAAQPEPA
jgi:putative flippase GtrA